MRARSKKEGMCGGLGSKIGPVVDTEEKKSNKNKSYKYLIKKKMEK